MNWILLRIKNVINLSEYGFFTIILGSIFTVIGLMASFIIPFHLLWWIYGAGVAVMFLATSRINCELAVTSSTSAHDVKDYLIISSFLWAGHAVVLSIGLVIGFVALIFDGLMNIHTTLGNFKFSLPRRKVKTIKMEPLPNSDPYRTQPQVCESCGNTK